MLPFLALLLQAPCRHAPYIRKEAVGIAARFHLGYIRPFAVIQQHRIDTFPSYDEGFVTPYRPLQLINTAHSVGPIRHAVPITGKHYVAAVLQRPAPWQ